MAKKILKGVVASNKMQNTLVVRVARITKHPKYKKRYTVSKRYQVHYNEGDYKVGDKVMIEETRPISKHKRWQIVEGVGQEVGPSSNSNNKE